MSLADDAFIDARLAYWQRHITQTATRLIPPQTGPAHAAMGPVLDQLVAVYNLAGGLVADLRQSADGSLATSDAGRAYLSQLATALAHSNRAATHLSTAVIRLTPHPGTAVPAESQLAVTLGHAAALRSLYRALAAVTSPLSNAQPPRRRARASARCRRAARPGRRQHRHPSRTPPPLKFGVNHPPSESPWRTPGHPFLHRPPHRHRVRRRLRPLGRLPKPPPPPVARRPPVPLRR